MSEGRELEWDDEIQNESSFIELPEGDYNFVIDHYDRARSKGEGKLPPCNMAIVYFNIKAPDGREVQLKENFILHESMEWKLSQLFRSVGLKKDGEKVRMNWQALPGLKGRAKVTLEPGYKDPTKKYNAVKELYPAEPKKFTPGSF